MRMKAFLTAICILAAAGQGWGADCASLGKELNSLRSEYKEYASNGDKTKVTFDGLAEILDKIVKVKGEMTKAGCKKIPPRDKTVNVESTEKKSDSKKTPSPK